MPPEALALAFTASIYPPAVAAVIAFGRGSDVRLRVAVFVLAAAITTYAVGALLLFVLVDLGVGARQHKSLGPGVDIAIGVLLIFLAVRLRRPSPGAEDRHGPIEVSTATCRAPAWPPCLASSSTSFPRRSTSAPSPPSPARRARPPTSLLDLVAVVVVMLWLIEVPMLMLVAVPDKAVATLERVNAWFAAHGRALAVLVSAAAAIYFIVKGLADLLS